MNNVTQADLKNVLGNKRLRYVREVEDLAHDLIWCGVIEVNGIRTDIGSVLEEAEQMDEFIDALIGIIQCSDDEEAKKHISEIKNIVFQTARKEAAELWEMAG